MYVEGMAQGDNCSSLPKKTKIGVIFWKDYTEIGGISSNNDAVISVKATEIFFKRLRCNTLYLCTNIFN